MTAFGTRKDGQIEAFDVLVLGERPKFSRPRGNWEEA